MLVATNRTPSFSTANPAGSTISAQDLIDLRTAINLVRPDLGLPAATYSNPAPSADAIIGKTDFYDLRNGID
jgi:hypothetical protein